MLSAILAITLLAAAFGLLLGYSAIRFNVEGDPVVDKIDALLPQTQCGQCTFPGCRPYAEAIAAGKADINQCPPGGEATIQALADLLGREAKPLNPENGMESEKMVAVIDENVCIGCTLCIRACPVDAILGATKQMHTVIADECTGCKLCVEPCPVDCIRMEPVGETLETWRWPFPGKPEIIPHVQATTEQERKSGTYD
jgi:electron transport complex protein RnfB